MLLTRAIPERLRDELLSIRRHTNVLLAYLLVQRAKSKVRRVRLLRPLMRQTRRKSYI